jgi:putative tricarboxylic transport membrane protein
LKLTQDAVQGGLFAAIGLTALAIALNYPLGTPGRMGPGFFPVAISGLLSLTGIAIIVRGWLGNSETIRFGRWVPIIIVSCAILAFGFLLDKLGLPLSVLFLCVAAGSASIKFALDWKVLAAAVAFSALCGVIFITLLGLPIPVFGSWLSGSGLV